MTLWRQLLALGVSGSAMACEPNPRAAPVARDSVVAQAPADTVVRRVYRVTRRATSIQRVTGVLSARRALVPLDSTLVVRIYDQRAEELRGVRVHWAAGRVADGGALRVVTGTTDTLGLSRASFTPGRSADVQSVFAEVPGVGRIEFAVTIAPAALRIVPDQTVLWADDSVTTVVELRDVAGQALPGGVASWAATDTTVAQVRSETGARGRIQGRRAGTTMLVAWSGAGEPRDTARVIVRPVVSGRFMTLDGRAPPAMTLAIRSGAFLDTIPVREASFHRRVELPPDVEVEVDARASADSTYHDVRLRLGMQRELQNLVIVLVPRVVRIERGTYAGRAVRLDAVAAMRRVAGTAPFWRLVPISGRGPRRLLGWRESDLPLRIAFNHSRSSEAITPDDSTQFWSIARLMEQDLGRALFTPAMLDSGETRRNLVPVEISAQESQGHTFVSWAQSGDAGDGVLLFRRAATLRDPHVVTHELVHLLGFGHATAWATVSQAVGGSVQRLTADDVAYVQVAMRLRQLQQDLGARSGLPVAAQ